MENYTLSRTTTEGSAHLGASDILRVYPQTHARAQGECNTTTQVHVKLLWVMLLGNHWENKSGSHCESWFWRSHMSVVRLEQG